MWGTLFSAGLSAASSLLGGNAAKKAGKATAKLEIAQSQQTARNIRRRSKEAKSAAAASFASSGVDVGYGSPLEAERTIAFESEYDALNALLTGQRRAKAAKAGGNIAAQASALDAAGSLYSGWVTARDKSKGGT